MFTPAERDSIRTRILDYGRADERISGGAVTGSATGGVQDAWSDVDLAFGVRDGSAIGEVLADWTAMMHREHGALHHVDVVVGAWTYRVFLLASTLQVDIALAPAAEFGPRAPTFKLAFGESVQLPPARRASTEEVVGMGWLYALHVRSSLERGRVWQAEYFMGCLRGEVIKLACLRHGLPASEGRGADRLPEDVKAALAATLVGSLLERDLRRAFVAAIGAFVIETRAADPALAGRLEPVLRELAHG